MTMPILADASVWIDHFRRIETPEVQLLHELLSTDLLILGDLVQMEVLRGVADDLQHARMRRQMALLRIVGLGTTPTILRSSDNYRALRKRGITVRKSIDCIIATYCIDAGVELLHSDRDFDPFEEHLGLRVVRI